MIPFNGSKMDNNFTILQNSTDEKGTRLWNRTFGGPDSDVAYDIVSVGSGGFAITGILNNPGAAPVGDCFLMRLDSEGNQLWNQTYDASISGESLIETNDGGFAIAGYRGWLIRTDVNGNLLWNKTYQGEDTQLYLMSVIENRAGGFALVGYLSGQGYDLVLILTDSSGNLLSKMVYSGPSDDDTGGWGHDRGIEIIEHSNGGYVIAGSLDGTFALIRVDAIGNLLWRKSYQQYGSGEATSLTEADNSEIIVAGTIDDEVKVIHTDSSGNILWNETYGLAISGASIVRLPGRRIAISANRYQVSQCPWFAIIAANGTLLWERYYDSLVSRRTVYSLVTFGIDDFALIGSIESNGDSELNSQVWIMAISENLEPTEFMPLGIFSSIAIGIVALVIITYELIRRRRTEDF
ncbi:MAG: hypothetical protein ACFFF4_10790 [Candidatus Thorarchaeota archaeon]